MHLRGQKWKKSKIKRLILEVNERFQKIKCAYLLTKLKGKVIYKPLFIFSGYSLRGLSPVHTKVRGGHNLNIIFCFHDTPYCTGKMDMFHVKIGQIIKSKKEKFIFPAWTGHEWCRPNHDGMNNMVQMT